MSPEILVLSSAAAIPLLIIAFGIVGAKLLVRRALARKAASGARGFETDVDPKILRALSELRTSFTAGARPLARADASSALSPQAADALAAISEARLELGVRYLLKAKAALGKDLPSSPTEELAIQALEHRLRNYKSRLAAREASEAPAESEDQSAENRASRTPTTP
ncbi:MAG: hypothetical protein HZA66_26060 [Rhodopseudomonas palustris]|uniref:Uncharacterized protein n=1 Tax=Rhodopseudomonas palustris TaxID=1076 RepID=A0A933VX70_RHOPL|nr:hypothetical protein [Rhodopseudomonas palustris]